jgi:thioredoxin-dependent peroxiredoxin
MPILSWLFSQPLAVGSPAPQFTLPDQNGRPVSLRDFAGQKNVLLVFYPGDDTSVCTKQLCELRDDWRTVQSKDTVVLGINPQSAESHRKFIAKQHYPFPLLVDKGQKVAGDYHAGGLIVRRTVYLIGKDGRIQFAQRGKPEPEAVLMTAR